MCSKSIREQSINNFSLYISGDDERQKSRKCVSGSTFLSLQNFLNLKSKQVFSIFCFSSVIFCIQFSNIFFFQYYSAHLAIESLQTFDFLLHYFVRLYFVFSL